METRSAVAGGLTTTAIEMRSGRRRLDNIVDDDAATKIGLAA
jgi:hypothetical protein